MSNEHMSALAPRVSTEAAAVCSIGRHGFCNWFDSSAGAEISATAEQHAAEISAAAQQHAAENPGHEVTCQVKETRTWSILRSDTTEGE